MITREDYLKAREIIKQYNLQQKTKKPKTNKRLIILEKSNEEIKGFFYKHFEIKKYFYFTQLVKLIQIIYEQNLNKKIGRNNAVIIIGILIERNIIEKKGEHGFSTYFLNLK
jgi:hypothetical protein